MTVTLEDAIKRATIAADQQVAAEASHRQALQEAHERAARQLYKVLVGKVAAITERLDLVHVTSPDPDSPEAEPKLPGARVSIDKDGPRVFGAAFRAPEGTTYTARIHVDSMPEWTELPEVDVHLDLGVRCCRRKITAPVLDAVTHLAALKARQQVLQDGTLPLASRLHVCSSSIYARN